MPYLLFNQAPDGDGISHPIILNTNTIDTITKDPIGRALITTNYGRTIYLEETFEHLLDILNVPF